MSRRFFVEQEAWDDVDRFVKDYEAQQPGVGLRFKKELFITFNRVERFPFMYAKVRGRL
ncbi:hypothetical protein BH11PLA2_BH11PLA2_09100 [soil metagenome]